MMRLLASALLVLGVALGSSGCCCPLGTLLSLCVPNTGLTAAAAPDRAQLDRVPAAVPVAARAASAAPQRF